MADEDKGTELQDADDINYMIVRGMINLAALGVIGGLFVLLVAILLTID